MALKTYIGPDDPVRVVVAGHDFGTIYHGCAISVPDELAESVAWSEINWRDGAPSEGGNE